MFDNQPFWQYLDFTQKELVKQSYYLLSWAKKHKNKLHDYSFVVMPAAKAYEGFLKRLLYDLELINQEQFNDDYFRIGKALNPELEHVQALKDECLYNEISSKCNPSLAKLLWQTWKKSRNRLFHYFVKEQQAFTLQEAEERLNQVIKAIEIAFSHCKVR